MTRRRRAAPACALFHKRWSPVRAQRRTERGAASSGWLVGSALLVVVVLGLAGLVDGAAGVRGAAVGLALTLLVFGFGMWLTGAVARVSPALSLLIALLTYSLQLLVLLVALLGIERSDLLDGVLDREWLGATIIGATIVWTAALALYHTRTTAGESSQGEDFSDDEGGLRSG